MTTKTRTQPLGIERKTFPFQLSEKGVNMEERTFEGYFAVMGNWDGWDVIDKGAFKKTLKERGHRVRVFWIHDFYDPIGRPTEIREVPRGKLPPLLLERAPDATAGLFVKGEVDPIPQGDRALIQMKTGTLSDGSIGFKAVKEYYEERDDGSKRRHVKELILFDISPVPIGMNVGTMITDLKSIKVEVTEEFITVPVPTEEGKHEGDDHTIRYIPIDPGKGIRAKWCVEDALVISYVFEKSETWDTDASIAWVEEHTKGDEAVELLALISKTLALEAVKKAQLAALVQYADFQALMLVDIQGQAEPS